MNIKSFGLMSGICVCIVASAGLALRMAQAQTPAHPANQEPGIIQPRMGDQLEQAIAVRRPNRELVDQVKACLKDFKAIQPGMTRREVAAQWPREAGLQGSSPARYVHPACAYFKIDVEFDCQRNVADQGRAVTSPEDKVTRVSKPYLEAPFFD